MPIEENYLMELHVEYKHFRLMFNVNIFLIHVTLVR